MEVGETIIVERKRNAGMFKEATYSPPCPACEFCKDCINYKERRALWDYKECFRFCLRYDTTNYNNTFQGLDNIIARGEHLDQFYLGTSPSYGRSPRSDSGKKRKPYGKNKYKGGELIERGNDGDN